LPVSLPAVIERYQHRYFKIKLSGDPGHDIERLRAVLATIAQYVSDARYTLDANEQYADCEALEHLLQGLRDLPQPLCIEQPLLREASRAPALKALRPLPRC
jgi:L-alanine-DL-glutamate epimerase-like enolase superfamily enzyme